MACLPLSARLPLNAYPPFTPSPRSLPQVNPLAEDVEGKLIAADAKMGFDDNAAFRQKAIFAEKDDSQIDPRRAGVFGGGCLGYGCAWGIMQPGEFLCRLR